MKIEIETNGDYQSTVISINGEKLLPPRAEVKEFHLSIHTKGKVKLQITKFNQETEKYDFVSMYGGDFEKFDEFNHPLISESQGRELKGRIKKEG